MKKPILFNADGSTENVTPIYSQGDYDVFVGALEEDKLPMYVVINRNSHVVEFTHEITAVYKEWLNHYIGNIGQIKEQQTQQAFAFKN